MKPLTIKELKALEVGDWVWVVDVETGYGQYVQLTKITTAFFECLTVYCQKIFEFPHYGTKWLAYKNKEQAEAKGEIVEFPCKVGDYVYIVDNDRHWAKIDAIHIYEEHNGKQKIVYEWIQLDVGVDITELWDEDEFDSEEIGKTVLLEKAHEKRIKALIDEENKKFAEWEQKCGAERRLAELKGELLK